MENEISELAKIEQVEIDRGKLLVEKISAIKDVLEAYIPESNAYGESRYCPLFNEEEREPIKQKLFELINSL